jgi:hypothetical protein
VSEGVSKNPWQQLLMELSFIKHESLGKRNTWVLVEDQYSKMKWSIFSRRKCDTISGIVNFI